MSNCCRLLRVSVEKFPLKIGINCESHDSTGFGRRLAVISCAWFCWICVRAALIVGLLAKAREIACSSVICVAAGRSDRGTPAPGVGTDCPLGGAAWLLAAP